MILDLHSESCHSLKEKRKIVVSIKEKLKLKYNISIIESDHQDVWQKIQLAIAMVSLSKVIIEKVFTQIEDFVFENYPVQLISVDREYT